MSKIMYYDLETTGVDYKVSSIRQISGFIEIDGVVMEEFNYMVKPVAKNLPQFPHNTWVGDEISINGVVWNRGAIELVKSQGITSKDVEGYRDTMEVFNELQTMLLRYIGKFNNRDKFHLIGFNNRFFDDPFFRRWFEDCGEKYFGSYFWADSIDALVIASHHLKDRRHLMENFKLMTVAKFLGIEVDESQLHDALYDVKLTKEIYIRCTQ
jgi:DNA polymerase-3 subunit epsilon